MATSAQLQRQRANLTTTLDVLRAMEGVAQVRRHQYCNSRLLVVL